MKLLLMGLWVLAVALGAAYGMAVMGPSGTDTAKAAAPPAALQTVRTRVINVPVLADGRLRGFVTAQFAFTADGNLSKAVGVAPDAYLIDEAFRTLYADSALDPRHVERYDLRKLTSHLVASTNERLGAPLIKDVLIENFSYVDKDAGKG